MKLPLLRFMLILALAVSMAACVQGLKLWKSPESASTQPSVNPADGSQSSPTGAPPSEEFKLPPPPASYQSTKDGRPDVTDAAEYRQKEEVNEAALKFAREVPNVKYVKTCFSKIYGGWYLILYVEKEKKVSLQQYSWNPRNREWEVIYNIKEIPPNQLEYHLKGEVGDEKCFVLKK
jgi:hypothetical protein